MLVRAHIDAIIVINPEQAIVDLHTFQRTTKTQNLI